MKKGKFKGKCVRALAGMISVMLITGTAYMPVFAAQEDGNIQEEYIIEEDDGSGSEASKASADYSVEEGEDVSKPKEDADQAASSVKDTSESQEGEDDRDHQEDAAQDGQGSHESDAGQDAAAQGDQGDAAQDDQGNAAQDEKDASAVNDTSASKEEEDTRDHQEEAVQDGQDGREFDAGQDAATQSDQGDTAQDDRDNAVQDDRNDAVQDEKDASAVNGTSASQKEENAQEHQEEAADGQSGNAASSEEIVEAANQEERVSESSRSAAITSNGGTITLAVNESKTVYLNIPSNEAPTRTFWETNSSNLAINSYGTLSKQCTITALTYTSSPLIVDCTYYTQFLDSKTNRIITKQNYASFTVYIKQGSGGGSDGGGSSDGSYKFTSWKNSINLDRTGSPNAELVVTCSTNLSDTVYIRDNSSKGNYVAVSLIKTEGNRAYFDVYGIEVGSQNIIFELIYKKDANTNVIKDKITVRVNVTCSHYYDKGVVTKEPTETSAGTKVYTCRSCKHQKTETIPATGSGISKCEIQLSATSYTYNGSACKPSVTVKQGGTTLTSGTDYTVSYKDNINAGTATVTITGKGIYSGTVSKTFTIKKADQTLNVSASSTTIKPGATAQLTSTGTGSITYTSANTSVATVNASGLITGKAAGTTTITVTAAGNSNYNSAKKTITIIVTNKKAVSLTFSSSSVSLNKGASKVVTVSTKGDLPARFTFVSSKSDSSKISTSWTGGWKKDSGTHSYDITITSLAAGTATVTVYLKDTVSGEYITSGTINVKVTDPAAVSKKITSDCVKLSATSYTYNGNEKKPSVTVKIGDKTLKKGTDFTVSYSSNKNAGTAYVTVKGKGKYSGTVKKSFTIKKATQGFYLLKSSFTFKKSDLKKKSRNVPVYAFKYKGALKMRSSSKYVKFSNGEAYMKKGTPKGTYTIIVSAPGNSNYKAKELTITVKVK